jgi:nucleotide-binding universal stress UspA family protein
MKILFPTDFSNAAEHAYVYALKLAERLGATITVVHVYKPLELHTWIENSVGTDHINEKIALGEFEHFKEQIDGLKRIAEENRLAEIVVNYALRESDHTVESILKEAEDMDAEIIVMGTKGATGLKEVFLGSIASKVMEQASRPVFAVPESATYKGIKKIGLPLEYKSGELELIEKSLSFARRMGGQLHCVHVDVYDPAKVQSILQKYKEAYLNELDISFHTYYELNIEKGIMEFMKFNVIDVIIMRVHPQSLLKDLFSYSIAKRIAYHSEIPLMALHMPAHTK